MTVTLEIPDSVVEIARTLGPEEWERALSLRNIRVPTEDDRARAIALLESLPDQWDEEAEAAYRELCEES